MKKKKGDLTNSNLIKFIVNFLKLFYPQTYPHSEEFGTVIEDDDDTNVNSEKELSLEQKLQLTVTKKISTNQNTMQKSAISKTIRQKIDLFEDEGFRGYIVWDKYHDLPSELERGEKNFNAFLSHPYHAERPNS
ncbi:uncharacterized protein TNCV_3146341 [Trichonephila clavipes]|nr:uncharacterized protein TNCV_3146341 [Trichonephila clavipes]